jgi:glycosyltransferase involved in cell wall biosynthesis
MLAILNTHPIQYYAPIWSRLSKYKNLNFEIWYLHKNINNSFDEEFNRRVIWDSNLLKGYKYRLPLHCESFLRFIYPFKLPHNFFSLILSRKVKVILLPGWGRRECWEIVFISLFIPISLWVRGDSHLISINKKTLKSYIKKLLLSFFFKRISKFLYVGSSNKNLYTFYGISKKKMIFTPHAVDNNFFRKNAYLSSREWVRLRQKYKISPDAFCILFAGKFISVKNPFLLIYSLRFLSKMLPNFKFHLLYVGSGILKNEIQDLWDSYFSENKSLSISFTGFLNQSSMPKVYAISDILVLPSTSETWGLVVNEAYASSLPCIVSNVCGCAEDLVRPIDSRLIFKNNSPISLANSLFYYVLFENKRVIKNKLIKILKIFDINKTAQNIKNLTSLNKNIFLDVK